MVARIGNHGNTILGFVLLLGLWEGLVRLFGVKLYILPAPAWDEKLAFRDALRGDPTLAAAYAAEKQRAAQAVGWDKTAYSIEKGPFIQAALRRLRERHTALHADARAAPPINSGPRGRLGRDPLV